MEVFHERGSYRFGFFEFIEFLLTSLRKLYEKGPSCFISLSLLSPFPPHSSRIFVTFLEK